MATVTFGGGLERTQRVIRWRTRRIKYAVVAAASASLAWWALGRSQPVAETGAVADAVVRRAVSGGEADLRGSAAVERCRTLLIEAADRLESIPAMTAMFQKQERIEGELQVVNVIELKARRAPLAVYLKWRAPEEGQEVIYRDGAFDGKMLVCPAGWKRNVMRMVKIAPDSERAMAVSRRPITNVGIWNFTDRVRQTIDQELLRNPQIETSHVSGDEISGRPCDRFTFERHATGAVGEFHKMVVHIDRTLGVPVALEHYRWGDVDGTVVSRLEESYLFRDLNLDAELADVDFDETNPAYEFVKK
jgi:hypothetical protein